MQIFNSIKNILPNKKEKYTGVSSFDKPVSAWDYDELVSSGQTENPFRVISTSQKLQIKRPKRRWQWRTSSCVAQTMAGMDEEVLGYSPEISATPYYQNRRNPRAEGMSYVDVTNLLPNMAIYSENDVKSQGLTEQEINVIPYKEESPLSEAVLEPYWVKKDWYDVARAVRERGFASIWFKGTLDEWQQWVINKLTGTSTEVAHSVIVVDAVSVNSVEYLVMLDSSGYYRPSSLCPDWLEAKDGVRLITKSAFESGVFAQWTAKPKEIKPVQKPKVLITKRLSFGMRNDDQVRMLQRVLIYEKLLDVDSCTGNYMNATRSAFKQWQMANSAELGATFSEINSINGMYVGPKSMALINKLYA